MSLHRSLHRVGWLALLALAGCGSGGASCPPGETPQNVTIVNAICSGSVAAPASLALPSTLPQRCTTKPTPSCALIDDCLASSASCSMFCIDLDPLQVTIGLSGLPFAGAVTLPDPRVELVMNGARLQITSGTLTAAETGASFTASFTLTFTTAAGDAVQITSGRYTASVQHGKQCVAS
jgi:hypothetical protein